MNSITWDSYWWIFSEMLTEWKFQQSLVKDLTSLKGFDINESINNSSLGNRIKLIKAAAEESEWKEYSGLRITVINGNIKVIKTLYPIYVPMQIGTYKIIIIGEIENK